MESQGGLQGTRPAAAAVLGISPAAELSLLGSQMHTSNRSACHPCSNRVSATSRTAVYGPVRTVVWEGRSCEAPPYPDQSLMSHSFGPLVLFARGCLRGWRAWCKALMRRRIRCGGGGHGATEI